MGNPAGYLIFAGKFLKYLTDPKNTYCKLLKKPDATEFPFCPTDLKKTIIYTWHSKKKYEYEIEETSFF